MVRHRSQIHTFQCLSLGPMLLLLRDCVSEGHIARMDGHSELYSVNEKLIKWENLIGVTKNQKVALVLLH